MADGHLTGTTLDKDRIRKIRSIPEISDRGRQSGNISTPQKKQKTNHWDDRNDAEDFCFNFFSGQ